MSKHSSTTKSQKASNLRYIKMKQIIEDTLKALPSFTHLPAARPLSDEYIPMCSRA